MVTKAEIISLAFTKLGRQPIADADLISGPPEVKAAVLEYELLRDNALAVHPWRFSTLTVTLQKLTDAPPVAEFSAAFMLPADYIQLERIRPLLPYRMFENMIYVNAEALQLDYRSNLGELAELKFPKWFTLYMVYHLASNIAMMVTQNVQIAESWGKVAGEQLLRARYLDSIQQPNESIVHDQVLAAHFATGIRGAVR